MITNAGWFVKPGAEHCRDRIFKTSASSCLPLPAIRTTAIRTAHHPQYPEVLMTVAGPAFVGYDSRQFPERINFARRPRGFLRSGAHVSSSTGSEDFPGRCPRRNTPCGNRDRHQTSIVRLPSSWSWDHEPIRPRCWRSRRATISIRVIPDFLSPVYCEPSFPTSCPPTRRLCECVGFTL